MSSPSPSILPRKPDESEMAYKFRLAALDNYAQLLREPAPFQESYIFFYDALTSPDTLQEVLSLDRPPVLKNATILAHVIKKWGRYPAAILAPPGPDVPRMSGKVYRLTQAEHLERLKAYETNKYRLSSGLATIEGDIEQYCWLFYWNGSPDELEDL